MNRKSKYFGFYAWVDKKMSSDDRYKLLIEPKPYENTDEYHINFIRKWDAPKWLSIITYEEQQDVPTEEQQK
ncbi:hypothetical protein D3C86_2122610 [compost metagenome]